MLPTVTLAVVDQPQIGTPVLQVQQAFGDRRSDALGRRTVDYLLRDLRRRVELVDVRVTALEAQVVRLQRQTLAGRWQRFLAWLKGWWPRGR